jgi:ATP-dependent Clp protease adaptor protein ClpS
MPAPTVTPDVMEERREKFVPLYHVVLLDDDDHTYDYVVEMLQQLFMLSEAQAFRHAVEVDTNGRTVVITCELPQAEFAATRSSLRADRGCRGKRVDVGRIEPAA